MLNRNQKGFTLIELMMVLAIIGILCALILPVVLETDRMKLRKSAVACMNELNISEYPKEFKEIEGNKVKVQIFKQSLIVIIHSENLTLDLTSSNKNFYEDISYIQIGSKSGTKMIDELSKFDPALLESYEQKMDKILTLMIPDMKEDGQTVQEIESKEEERLLKEAYDSVF